jgi:hypothetical protein
MEGPFKEITGGWFPIFDEALFDPGFMSLTATEKVFYWYLASEFNESMSKRFFRADAEFAVALRLSEVKVRQARRKFERLGLITITPGTRTNRGNLATVYHSVKWSRASEYNRESRDSLFKRYSDAGRVPGLPFSKFHRHTYNVLVSKIRSGQIHHRDLVVYVILFHWAQSKDLSRSRKASGAVHISKRVLITETGDHRAPASIGNLHEGMIFSEGSHLFTYIHVLRSPA